MKNIFILLFIIAFIAIGCKKNIDVTGIPGGQPDTTAADTTDTTAPDDTVNALPGLLLHTGLSQTASGNANNYLGLTRWMGYWARSGDFPPDEQTETYNLKNDYTNAEWKKLYENLDTYDSLERTAKERSLPFYIGAAKVMKAYCFSTLVDLYNDVPYKEAFEATTRNHPVYDNGLDIYNDLVAQLDSAIIYFEQARSYYQTHAAGAASSDDRHDIMFGSARSKLAGYNERLTLWEKLTNTLELKLLVHQSQMGAQQSFIQTKISSLTTSGERSAAGFIGAGESAAVNPGYHASPGKMNPLYGLFFNADGSVTSNINYYTANTYAYDFYKSGNDGRQFSFYDATTWPLLKNPCSKCGDTAWLTSADGMDTIVLYHFTDGPVVAVYKGDTLDANDFGSNYDGDPAAHRSIFSYAVTTAGIFKHFGQDQFIFSDFESLFLQAELVQRGYLPGNAQNLYESAITRNFAYLAQTEDNMNPSGVVENAKNYFTQNKPNISWAASPNKLEAILTQKWAAMNGVNWVESYNDFRRTGYPTSSVLGISHAPSHLQPMIPIRFLYPQSQLNTNGSNTPQLGANAQFTSRVFWDQ